MSLLLPRNRPRLAAVPALVLAALAAMPGDVRAAGASVREASASLATPIRYPRLGLPGVIHRRGDPYLDASGNLDPTTIEAVSRFDLVIVDASPISEYFPQVIAALRARNPRITALGYVVGENIWEVNDPDSLVHYPTRYNHMIRDLDGYLYNRQGGYHDICRVNVAKRDDKGRYVVAEAVAQLFYDAVASTGVWDGLFVDVFCDGVLWTQTTTDSIDFVRAGYPDAASFDAAWHVGADTLANRLRRLCGPDLILVGNCGVGTRYELFNGWTRENFPLQFGGTWYTNMFRVPGGYFGDELLFRQPTHNVIYSPTDVVNPRDANTARRVRFALGSAALGTGFATFGPSVRDAGYPIAETLWYDEYAVDLATGRASTRIEDTGWLGEARGSWRQMIWVGDGPDAVSNPGFENDVTSGWALWCDSSVPTTVTWDTTTSAQGRASARIHVAQAGAADWYAAFGSQGTLALSAGTEHSVTFWARASKPRPLTVAAAVKGTSYGFQIVDVGTTWRQYQVVLIPKIPGTAQVQFYVAAADGDLWLDDVHFQAGATSLYRRDFQNGIILLNPAARTLNVPLEATYRKILGVVDPATNDGSSVDVVAVPPSDAIFLIGDDATPPAAPLDLRIVR